MHKFWRHVTIMRKENAPLGKMLWVGGKCLCSGKGCVTVDLHFYSRVYAEKSRGVCNLNCGALSVQTRNRAPLHRGAWRCCRNPEVRLRAVVERGAPVSWGGRGSWAERWSVLTPSLSPGQAGTKPRDPRRSSECPWLRFCSGQQWV